MKSLSLILLLSAATIDLTAAEVDQRLAKAEETPPPGESAGYSSKHYLELGYRLESAKNYDEALAAFTKAIELDPASYEAHFSRGSIYASDLPADRRNPTGAVADYTRCLEIRPRDCSARHNRALEYEQMREYDRAIADYTLLIEGDTDFSRLVEGREKQLALAHFYRGRIYHGQSNDWARAVADYNRALRLDPGIAEPGSGGRIILRRAQALHSLKKYEAAAADFERYSNIDSDYFELWRDWAWLLATCPDARFRNGALAMEYGKKVSHPETMAAAYAESQRFDEAVQWQIKAINALTATAPEEKRKAAQARLELYQAGLPYREN